MVADTQQSSAHAAHFNSAVYMLDRVPEVGQGVVAFVSQHELRLEPRVALQHSIQVFGEIGSLIPIGRAEDDVEGYSVAELCPYPGRAEATNW